MYCVALLTFSACSIERATCRRRSSRAPPESGKNLQGPQHWFQNAVSKRYRFMFGIRIRGSSTPRGSVWLESDPVFGQFCQEKFKNTQESTATVVVRAAGEPP